MDDCLGLERNLDFGKPKGIVGWLSALSRSIVSIPSGPSLFWWNQQKIKFLTGETRKPS